MQKVDMAHWRLLGLGKRWPAFSVQLPEVAAYGDQQDENNAMNGIFILVGPLFILVGLLL